MLLNRKTFESGAMPDVATNAYPLLYSDMSGYTIVERLGMSIQRFQDSYTGPNKVEFHVRRRLGGRVEKPWLFAVQKVDEESSI
jgi:HK97 family phage major capsid protein